MKLYAKEAEITLMSWLILTNPKFLALASTSEIEEAFESLKFKFETESFNDEISVSSFLNSALFTERKFREIIFNTKYTT